MRAEQDQEWMGWSEEVGERRRKRERRRVGGWRLR